MWPPSGSSAALRMDPPRVARTVGRGRRGRVAPASAAPSNFPGPRARSPPHAAGIMRIVRSYAIANRYFLSVSLTLTR